MRKRHYVIWLKFRNGSKSIVRTGFIQEGEKPPTLMADEELEYKGGWETPEDFQWSQG
jgi:hypothetical protein